MAGGHASISLFLIANGSHEVELGMVDVSANHAVGVGEPIEEAAGFIVFPSEGRGQTIQIHPNHATFPIVVKMGVLHRAGSGHEAVASGTSERVEFFLKAAFYRSKGSVPNHSAVTVMGKFPEAGGVPNKSHLPEMVAGELPSRSIVAVGDGDKFSCQWSIGVRRDNASGLGDGFRTVELVVGSENAGAVGIGFLQFHSRGLVVEPGGSVPVGAAGRISGDVPFVHPESGQ